MRRIAAVLFVTCALWVASLVQSSAETLYYLDQQRNVSAVNIEGSRATRHRLLSTAGGYHGFCVSPDETQVFGWKEIGRLYEDFPVFKCFLEGRGRQKGTIGGPVIAEEAPSAEWLPGNSLLLITFPQQVETQSVLYSVRGRKVTCDTKDAISTFSADQRHCFVEQDIGHDADGAAKLRLLDAHSGKTAHVTSVRYTGFRGIPPYTWLGNTNRFAVVDVSGRVLAGEVRATRSGPSVRTWHLTRYGGCSDLRYLPGKGVYFVQTSGKSCQPALNIDPPSASNIDPPLWVILALRFWSLSSSYRCLFL